MEGPFSFQVVWSDKLLVTHSKSKSKFCKTIKQIAVTKKDIEKKKKKLTSWSSSVNEIFLSKRRFLFLLLSLIKYLGFTCIRIVNTSNSVSPTVAKQAISATKELLFVFEISVCFKLVLQVLYFFSRCFGSSQNSVNFFGSWWIKGFFDSLKSFSALVFNLIMLESLTFKKRRPRDFFKKSRHIFAFLQRRWPIVQINKVEVFVLISAQIQKGHWRLDRLTVDEVVWQIWMSCFVFHHRCLLWNGLVTQFSLTQNGVFRSEPTTPL